MDQQIQANFLWSAADMLVKGYDPKNIKIGNALSDDQLPLGRFNDCLANPPFGVDWKKVQKKVTDEHDPEAEYCKTKGTFDPDADLRDNEYVPLAALLGEVTA